MTETRKHTLLLDVEGTIQPETPRVHYLQHVFTVPDGIGKLYLNFDFHKKQLAQLFISLHGPDGFRGNRMNPGAKGDVSLELWITPDDASEGAIPGPIVAGEWRAQIDIEAIGEVSPYRLTITAEDGPPPEPVTLAFPDDLVVKAEAGWYRGELHAHSTESDGKHTVETVVEAAIDAQLDFFALTDHFTVSQWRKLVPYCKHLALLRSTEITSHQGHANLHGMKRWVDVFVDRDDWSMNQAADAVHADGGLFCVNHAFSGRLGWQAYDFDWHKADLMEVYHNLEAVNNVYQVSLWDSLLMRGYKIVGVAGIDSHDPFTGRHKLGQLMTWVYADELSEAGIIGGLKRGQVFLSKGAQMRFSATNGEQIAQMWDALVSGHAIFSLDVCTDTPLRAFVFKNGLNFDSFLIEGKPGEWQTFMFEDTPNTRSYYRVELHRLPSDSDYAYLQWRDHTTLEAISNPIWVS